MLRGFSGSFESVRLCDPGRNVTEAEHAGRLLAGG